METKPPNTNTEISLNPKQWADLPKDVLLHIIRYLDLKTDVPRLRGVCPSWRSAVPLHELPVHKYYVQVPNDFALDECNLPNRDSNNNLLDDMFLLEAKFYLFTPLSADDGDFGGWVARVGEIGTNRLQLLSPLDCYHYKIGQKYIYTEPPITGEINLLDCHVLELATLLCLVHGLDHNVEHVSKKVVGEWDFTSSQSFSVMVQLKQNIVGSGSDLLLLRSGDEEWVKLSCIVSVHDIAFHNGKFYVFFYNGEVGVINQGNSSVSKQIISGPDIFQFSDSDFDAYSDFSIKVDGCTYDEITGIKLVPSKSKNGLYLVIQGILSRTYIMFVFLMKDLEIEWERVENLGDEMFFIGDYSSFACPSSVLNHVNVPDNWKLKSICCYSTYHGPPPEVYGIDARNPNMPEGAECLKHLSYPHYNGFFRFLNGVLQFKEMPMDDQAVYTRLFFPPPAWVKWRCASLDDVQVKLDGLQLRDLYDDGVDYDYGDYDI